MAKKLLDKVKLNLGRLLGQSKRKDRDVVELWTDMCNANGIKTTDRLLELLAWDLKEGGVDLREYRQIKHNEKIDEAFQEAQLADQIRQLSMDFAMKAIERDRQHAAEMAELINIIKQQQLRELAGGVEGNKDDKGKRSDFDLYTTRPLKR